MVKAADRMNDVVERRFWLFGALLAAGLLACSVARDVAGRMWIDELYTLHMSKQANAAEIVRATLEGCDGAAPLYAMTVQAIRPWVGHEALAVRLPATLGYAGMIVCLLAFCRRLLPAVYSLVAVMLACRATLEYASEGRGYGVVLGCAAGALLCWQAAAEGRRRAMVIPVLAVCLAVMTATHYYAVFILVPLFLAEMVRWRASGKLDFAILAAMAPVLLVLGLHYPLIEAGRQAVPGSSLVPGGVGRHSGDVHQILRDTGPAAVWGVGHVFEDG